jgi:hypothetical protein
MTTFNFKSCLDLQQHYDKLRREDRTGLYKDGVSQYFHAKIVCKNGNERKTYCLISSGATCNVNKRKVDLVTILNMFMFMLTSNSQVLIRI